MALVFITSNLDKFREFNNFLPSLTQKELDLPEMQTLDSEQLIKEKLLHAKEYISDEVIVEDTALTLKCLNDLPGPFIKYFEKSMGLDGIYNLCNKYEQFEATAITKIGYANSNNIMFFNGSISGIVCQPRGENGFGWDRIFIPDGYDKTFAEMSDDTKMQLSMRSKALSKFVNYLHLNG